MQTVDENQSMGVSNESAEVSLLDVIQQSWKRVLVLTLFGLLVGVVASFVMTKYYRAEVVVSASESDSGAAGATSQLAQLAGIAGIGLASGGSGYRQEAIATLRSHETAREFIQSKNIAAILAPDEYRGTTDGGANDIEVNDQRINRVTDFFQKHVLDVREDRRTGMVVVSILWSDPRVSAEWANALVRLTDEKLRGRRRIDAKKSLELLEEVIAQTNAVELKQTLYRMYQFELEKLMQTQVRDSLFFRIIDPATPPDEKDYVVPDPKLLIGGGVLLGFFSGLGVAVFLSQRRRVRSRH